MKRLLSHFNLNLLELSNRIVMAPMTRNMSRGHVPGPDVAQYYRRRAQGGVGLIITEGTVIGHKASNGYPDVPNFYGELALAGWRHVVQEVHQAGGKIFPQLWHVESVRRLHRAHNGGADYPKAQCLLPSCVEPPSHTGAILHVYPIKKNKINLKTKPGKPHWSKPVDTYFEVI